MPSAHQPLQCHFEETKSTACILCTPIKLLKTNLAFYSQNISSKSELLQERDVCGIDVITAILSLSGGS